MYIFLEMIFKDPGKLGMKGKFFLSFLVYFTQFINSFYGNFFFKRRGEMIFKRGGGMYIHPWIFDLPGWALSRRGLHKSEMNSFCSSESQHDAMLSGKWRTKPRIIYLKRWNSRLLNISEIKYVKYFIANKKMWLN